MQDSAGSGPIDVTLDIPVEPQPKARPRARVLPGGQATIYTPQTTKHWEAHVAGLAAAQMPRTIIEGPVRVDVLAVMARPKRLLRRADPDGLVWAPTRPDGDNIRKAVLDALAPFWRDDAQVVCGDTLKVYAEKTGRPRTVIRIQSMHGVGLLAGGPESYAVALGL